MSQTEDPGPEPAPPAEEKVKASKPSPLRGHPDIAFFVGTMVVALVMLLIAAGLSGDDDDDGDQVATEETTTTFDPASTGFTTTSGAPTTVTTTALTATDPGATSTTTQATAAGCRNSTNPACGPFRWDPAPGANQVMEVQTTVTPTSPRAGDVVTFTIVVRDDAFPRQGTTDFGDGQTVAVEGRCARPFPQGYGPWTPPPPDRGTFTLTQQHVYERPGTYMFRMGLDSSTWAGRTPPGDARGCPRDPYADAATVEVTLGIG